MDVMVSWVVMNLLGSCILFYDMNSIIYTKNTGLWEPFMGQYLGDLMNELSCSDVGCSECHSGHWLAEFVSCRAKHYAYCLNSGEVVCKGRGFSLNFSASQVVHLDSMKKALFAWKNKVDQIEMVTLKTMILRNKITAIVYLTKMPKHYGMVYNKRVVLDDFTTVPYGF